MIDKPIEALNKIYKCLISEPFRTQVGKMLQDEIAGNCSSILDVGCGDGSQVVPLKALSTRIIGVDTFLPAIEIAESKGLYDQVKQIDVKQISYHFEPNSFDAVMAFDLIEHLNKIEGYRLLLDMAQIAKKKVMIFTPNGFLPQEPHSGNIYQRHISGWDYSEMQSMGFRVTGVHGSKMLLGERQVPIFKPHRLCMIFSVLSQYLVEKRPKYAFQIFCVKDL